MLPQASTALHVLVSTKVPAQDPWTVTSLTSCTDAVEHASEAVGIVNDGTWGQEIVSLIPWPPIVGGVLSMTVIVSATPPLMFPQVSTALHVLVSTKVPAQDPWTVTSLTSCTDAVA